MTEHEGMAVAAIGALTSAGHILPCEVEGDDIRRGIKELARERDEAQAVIAEIERCRMIVQPHGPKTGCDHEWYAVACRPEDDETPHEGEGPTLAEAVRACALAYDAAAGEVPKLTRERSLVVPREVLDQEFMANRNETALDANEAKLRLLARQLPDLPCVPLPNGCLRLLEQTQREGAKQAAFESARTILQTAHALFRPAAAEFSGDNPWGYVEILWDVDRRLRWLVREPRIRRWPGVSVRVFWAQTPRHVHLETQSFWTAHTLLHHFSGFCEVPK